MADVGLRIKVDQFNAAMRDMQQRLADVTTMKNIIDYEVARILEKTLKETRAATEESITRSRHYNPSSPWRTYDIGLGNQHFNLSWRYPDMTWRLIEMRQEFNLQQSLAARGITKQSWLALASLLQQEIKAPNYVFTATVKNHNNIDNVGTSTEGGNMSYGRNIANNAPLLRFTGASQAFFEAVAGRRAYYLKNLSKGVFDSLETTAAKYPGIMVGQRAA